MTAVESYERKLKWLAEHPEYRNPPADIHLLDLSGKDLRGVNLSNRDLRGANFGCSDLRNANLSGTKLGAVWGQITLDKGRILYKSNLAGADLRGANLERCDLTGARLERARIGVTGQPPRTFYIPGLGSGYSPGSDSDCAEDISKLEQFDVRWTRMKDCILDGADLFQVHFNADLDSLPNAKSFAAAFNLDTLRYCEAPTALTLLREDLKKAGLKQQARSLTYDIRSQESAEGPRVTWLANFILFDLTCKWGASTGRPLLLLILFVLLFTFPYARALAPASSGRLWMVYPSERIERFGEQAVPERLTSEWRTNQAQTSLFKRLLRTPRKWFIALSFSLTSTFSIGWHDLNVGAWFTRIWAREYTIRATGWTKSLSGLQSIIGVYLLALWVLTYFGSPFDY